MKRIALILLAALLMLACPFAAAAFTDTEDLSPLEAAAVEKLSALGIMEGYPDGSFRPLEPVSRAELAKMLCVYVGQQQLLTSSLAFSDVPAAAWYYGWVSRAAELGWVNGYPDGSFMPRAGVTGEEAAAMLIRAADVDTALFSWPEDHVQAARDMGMLAGFNFTGAKTASRLDICLMIYNLLSAGKQTEPAAEDALADGLHIGVVKAPQERGFFLWYAEEQLPLDAAVPRPPAENTLICYTVKNGAVESWSLLLDIPNGNIYPATPLKYKAVKDGPYSWVATRTGKAVVSPVGLDSAKPLVRFFSYRNIAVGPNALDDRNYWLGDGCLFYEARQGMLTPGSRDSIEVGQAVTLLVNDNEEVVLLICWK